MCVVLFVPVMMLVAVAPLPPVADDAKLLQGAWTIVSYTYRGKKAPEDKLSNMSCVIKENTLSIEEDKRVESGTIKLDPTKKPKTLDLIIKDGAKTETALFIYELDGDNLKLCWSKPGGERPTAFSAEGTDGYMVLKRKK